MRCDRSSSQVSARLHQNITVMDRMRPSEPIDCGCSTSQNHGVRGRDDQSAEREGSESYVTWNSVLPASVLEEAADRD